MRQTSLGRPDIKKHGVRIPPGGAQYVQGILNSPWMQGYTFACVGYYVLFVFSGLLQETNLYFSLAMILIHGFVAAESMILYQRKEARNLRHLSVFCMIGMFVMFALCLFLGMTVATLNMEYSKGTEEILQFWAEADMSAGMPYMILSVVSVGLTGLSMAFLWKALGMSADLLERKGVIARNWFLPAAICVGINQAISLAGFILQPGDWVGMAVNGVLLVRNICLTVMMIQAAKDYKTKIG